MTVDDRADRERPQRPGPAAEQAGRASGPPSSDRGDHERQPLGEQAVEDVAGVGAEDDQPDRGEHAGDDRGARSPARREVVARAPRRRRAGSRRAGRPRRCRCRWRRTGRRPASGSGSSQASKARRCRADVTSPAAIAPTTRAHEERRDQRGDARRRAERAAAAAPGEDVPEGEAGAAQDDPERGQRQRHVERLHDRREGVGEAGPERRRGRRSARRGSPPRPGRASGRSARRSARAARLAVAEASSVPDARRRSRRRRRPRRGSPRRTRIA